MKELLNLGNGALVISEDAGQIVVVIAKSVDVGGGQAAGLIHAEGEGKVVFEGKKAFHLAMSLLELHSPAALVPLEQVIEGVADSVIDKL